MSKPKNDSNNQKWKILETEELVRLGFFRMRKDKCELPDGRVFPAYYVVEFNSWVQMLPITTDGQIVLVDQYRHATGDHYLEMPGGSLDPREGESEKDTAIRELQEETGYVPGEVEFLGTHEPNPAFQTNQVHIYLATGCEKKMEQNLDPFEDIEVVLKSPEELYRLAEAGEMKHSLMLASLMLARPKLKDMGLI